MKTPLSQLRNLIAVTLVMAATHLAPAQSIWNAVVGAAADTNWSTAANWSPGGVPSGDVIFNDATGVANGTVVNSVVDALFGNTISSLTYTNVATYQSTLIADGVTLNLSGNLTGGSTNTDYGTARTNYASLLGTNGTLWINNNTAVLYLGLGGTASTERSILDLSRLGTFNATLSQIQLGTAVGSIVRAAGTLYLARTNTITGTYPGTYISSGTTRNNVTIDIGDQNGNAGAASYLYLGLTNAIFADTIVAGKQKPAGYILFNPAFTYANSGASAYFRGQDGVGPVAVWNLGDGQGNTGSGVPPTGVADFTGGTVDALVTTMYLGRASSGGTATSTATGTLIFGPGLFNVGTLYVGAQPVNNLRNGVGTLTVNSGGTLLVSSGLTLGFTSAAGGAATTVGTLNIRGGTVQANSISTGAGSGANAITISGGTLVITNPVASSLTGVTNFMATNATLQVSALNGLPTAVVTSLVLGGPTNTVIVKSIPNVAAYPAQFTVIKYATLGGAAFNVGLGTALPPSTGNPYQGYISNNVANKSVDLVITDGPTPANTLTWAGTVADNNWNFGAGSDLNWLIGATSTNFNQGDFVTFDDTAADTTVNLGATLMPSGVNVTNNSKTYTFGGSGYLSGAGSLLKQGTGTLILDDSANDFTGSITIGAGTLQVGNNDGGGSLPPSSTVNNNSTLVFDQSSDLTVSSAISGTGALIKNNTDILTLSGANSFTGPVTVNQGILQAGINAALGATNGGTTVASGATLDVNGHNLGGEAVTVSGAGFSGLGAVVNQGASANPALSRVTLAGNTSLGGPGTQGYGGNLAGRWDIRLTSSGATDPAACSLSTGGNAYNLAKIGANYVALVNVTVDPALGDIDIQNGTLSFQYNTTSLGAPSKTLTVQPGATLDFYSATNLFNKQFVINGDPAGTINVLNNSAGTNTVIGPMTLSGNCIVNCANSTSLILNNPIGGSGSLLKAGAGTGALVLGGACSYTGGTMVSQGALLVDGTLSDGATNAASTILGGRGTVQGVVDVQGTLNPGSLTGPGTFTAAAGLLLESGAAVVYDLSATNTASGGANDLVQVNGDLMANSAPITVNLLQGTLQPGIYRLFNYSGALPNGTASFSSVSLSGHRH